MELVTEEIRRVLEAKPTDGKLGSVHVGSAEDFRTGIMLATELALVLMHPNYEIETISTGEYITFYASPHSQSS